MLNDSFFDENGAYSMIISNANVTSDRSHPDEWKGHFVIVKNAVAYAGKNRTYPKVYHRSVLRISKFGRIDFTDNFYDSFSPTIFRTYDDALRMIVSYATEVVGNWNGVEIPEDKTDISKYHRRILNRCNEDVYISPLFEILDACEYRISRPSDISKTKRATPKRCSGICHDELNKTWKDASTVITSGRTTIKEKLNDKFKLNSYVRFFAKETNTGKYLKITKETGLNGATLSNIEDSTYFQDLDSLLAVLNAIERTFWNSKFQGWHFMSTSAIVKDNKVIQTFNS